MVENIYTELKEKSKVHPGLVHKGNIRGKDFGENMQCGYIDEIQKNKENPVQGQLRAVFPKTP